MTQTMNNLCNMHLQKIIYEMWLLLGKIVLRPSIPRNNQAEFRSVFAFFFWNFSEVLKKLKIFEVGYRQNFGIARVSAKRIRMLKSVFLEKKDRIPLFCILCSYSGFPRPNIISCCKVHWFPSCWKWPCVSHQHIATRNRFRRLTSQCVLISQVLYQISVNLLMSSTHRAALCFPPENRQQTFFLINPLKSTSTTVLIINLYKSRNTKTNRRMKVKHQSDVRIPQTFFR